jgi:hypothetical protein
MSRHVKGFVGVSLGVVVGLFAVPETRLGAAETGLLRMTISEPTGGTDWKVLSDGQQTYADYRWTGGDLCLEGVSFSPGLAFMSLNRRMPDTLNLCEADNVGQARSYTIVIASATACLELQVPLEPFSTFCLASPDPGSITLVRAETLFKANSKSTTVVFIFDKHGVAYRVETNAAAQIVGTADDKMVTYMGQASLRPVGARSAIASFPLPFQLRFERQ